MDSARQPRTTQTLPRTTRRLDIVIDGFWGRGGTERQIVAIATGMAGRGWDVLVIVRWGIDLDGEHATELRDNGIRLITNAEAQRHRVWRSRAIAVAERTGFDTGHWSERRAYKWQVQHFRSGAVVHEIPFFGRIPPAGQSVYARTCVPLVHTILGTPAHPIEPAAPWAEMTGDGAAHLTDAQRTMTWIPSMTWAQASSAYEAPQDEIGLLFVGRLVESKGLDLLMSALETASPRFRLTVIGDGPERTKLVELAHGRVEFLGSLSEADVLAALRRTNVLVVPSRSSGVPLAEGMPTVIAEAMSQGRPVLATAVGGVPRLYEGRDPAPGLLVEPDSVTSLHDGLARLVETNLSKAAESATLVYRELLRPEVVLDAYERRYVAALARPPHR